MKILIDMSLERYDRFVAKCDITSREYSILTNGVIIRDQKSGAQRVIAILCDMNEAVRLLYAASVLHPEAVPAIKAGIDLSREP